MALKAILGTKEELDALPESVREHYVETDGKFHIGITPEDGFELANNASLKKALQQEKARATKFEADFKDLGFKFKGIDPVEAKTALEKMTEFASWDPEQKLKEAKEQFERQIKEQYDNDRNQLVTKHTSDMDVLKKSRGVLEGQLNTALVVSEATKAIAAADGTPELLLPVMRGQIRTKTMDDGTKKVEIFDADGLARLSPVAGSTEPMQISELVAELKANEKYGGAFKAPDASGGGASHSRGGATTVHTITAENAKDVHAYRTAREAAEKAGKTLEIVEDR